MSRLTQLEARRNAIVDALQLEGVSPMQALQNIDAMNRELHPVEAELGVLAWNARVHVEDLVDEAERLYIGGGESRLPTVQARVTLADATLIAHELHLDERRQLVLYWLGAVLKHRYHYRLEPRGDAREGGRWVEWRHRSFRLLDDSITARCNLVNFDIEAERHLALETEVAIEQSWLLAN